jgi:hypothetical protein
MGLRAYHAFPLVFPLLRILVLTTNNPISLLFLDANSSRLSSDGVLPASLPHSFL